MVSNLERGLQEVTKPKTQVENKAMNLAASWYIAMKSKKLGKKPKAIKLFSRPLVAWRDKLGKPLIMERFCSHMGASLAIGQVVDGCIQCPFHHWRYDNSGACVHIPQVTTPQTDRIPPNARQGTYVTEERYGYIWVWYGSVTPLFDLPKFDAAAESNKHKYMPYRFSVTAKTNVRRVVENLFDPHHIVTLHSMPIIDKQFERIVLNEEDVELSELPIAKEACFDSISKARMKNFFATGAITKAIGLNIETMSSRDYGWPSGLMGTMKFNGQPRIKLISCVTPISENLTTWHYFLMINKTGNWWVDLLAYLVLGWQNYATVLQDVPIFDTVDDDVGGAFIKPDEPVLRFRKFYQSWVDKAQ